MNGVSVQRPVSRFPRSAFRSPVSGLRFSSPAFTLIELLVAMAVLALMQVVMLNVMTGVMQSTRLVTQQMDSTQAARRALDVIAADVRDAVLTQDATILAATDGKALAMLTRGRGPAGSVDHRFLSVRYSGTTNLVRTYGSFSLGTNSRSGLPNFPVTGTNAAVLMEGLLGLAFQAVLEDGTRVSLSSAPSAAWSVTNYQNAAVTNGYAAIVPAAVPRPSPLTATNARAASLVVTIATLDSQNLKLLNSAQFTSLTNALADPGTNEAQATWESTISMLGIPAPARQSARVLSKTIPLP